MDKDMKICIGAGLCTVVYCSIKVFIRRKIQMKGWLKVEAKDMWFNKYGSCERNFCRRLWAESNKDINAYVRALASLPQIDNVTFGENNIPLSEKEFKKLKQISKCLREELDSLEEVIIID